MAATMMESIYVPRARHGAGVACTPRALSTAVPVVITSRPAGIVPAFKGLRAAGRPLRVSSSVRWTSSRVYRRGAVVCEAQNTALDGDTIKLSLHGRPKVSLSSKAICRMFFGNAPICPETKMWKCTCGLERKCDVVKNGYNNLMTQIKIKRPNFLDIFEAHSLETLVVGQMTLKYIIDSKSTNICKWLDWVIMDELELNFCEQEHTRENTSLSKICSKTLKKYMFKLVTMMENKIITLAMSCQRYALFFDGWSEDNTHFIGLFITMLAKDASVEPDIHLLAFAPLLDETSFTASNHRDFILVTLEWYHLPVDCVVCLIGKTIVPPIQLYSSDEPIRCAIAGLS